jgi:hypothetical protein
VRILDNLHYDHLKNLARLIDELLPFAGPIGLRVLSAKCPFQFDQAVAELFQFARLRGIFGERAQAIKLGPSELGPDVKVHYRDFVAKLEVYTPIELFRYQLFERYVSILLKYINVPCGFEIEVEYADSEGDSYYAYRFSTDPTAWLHEFVEKAAIWLSQASNDSVLRLPAPVDGIELRIRMVERLADLRCRCVHLSSPTKSSDSRLFFEVGTPADTAKTEWGRKLKEKLQRRQCGSQDAQVLRTLVVNFALADTGWPEFICWPTFGRRFDATIRCLVGGDLPYDLLIPGNLDLGT